MRRSPIPPGALATGLALAAISGLAACGSSSSSSTAPAGGGATKTTATSPSPGSSGPGAGKPAVTIGDKNFTEEYILGDLYAQALQAKGYKVIVKGNIGSSELTFKALKSGQIDMYPEYTGTLLTAVAGQSTAPDSAQAAYAQAQAYVGKQGFELLTQTPFYDTDAIGVLKSFATKNSLKSVADLKKLGSSFKLGGPPEFQTRIQGLVGLKKSYGVNPAFTPLTIGLLYKALDSGQVQGSDVFSTDAQLTSGKYLLLADPKHVFGFQYVAPVVRKSVVAAEGPDFAATINKVSSLLTVEAVQKMNAAVSLDQQSPQAVAQLFLKANGLA